MKYGSATAGMATISCSSNGSGYEHQGVISGGQSQTHQAMFAAGPMDASAIGAVQQQSSVIKTAPPGRASAQQQQQQMMCDFSPKQEPIDLTPLSAHSCLQDLGKMGYYASMNGGVVSADSNSAKAAYSAGSYYDYLNVGAAAAYHPSQSGPSASGLPAAVVALGGVGGHGHSAQQQDWPYIYSNQHHQHQQQQQQISYLSQLDSCAQLGLEQQQQRLYKNGLVNGAVSVDGVGGGLLSPVDSGIGQELLLEQAKQLYESFGSSTAASVLLPSHQQQTGQQQSSSSSQSVIHQHHVQQQECGQQQRQQRDHRSVEFQQQQPSSQQRVHESREQSIPAVIPKLDNVLGFQYTLESPISTSIRREDDRMTYVNKGQFYTVSLDYLPDLRCPLKGLNVRSQIMVVFREDKSYEDELRTWLVWYKRQHSPKQRIIEVDAKNSMGALGGHFEEIAHNAVQFCWNPAEQPGPKVSIAVQCLSTDFSTQKGVKGLPLHVQIDTYDDQADSKQPFHRGYCQIKVFCDKGANRKMLHENRRDERRRAGGGGTAVTTPTSSPLASAPPPNNNTNGSGSGRKKPDGEFHEACERSPFYHSADLERPAALFVPSDDFFFDTASIGSYEALSELEPQPKRPRPSERVMIYVRKPDEEVFTPLHLVPPTLGGLARAISEKYNLDESKIEAFYKQCQKGVTVKIDDDMLRHYSNQDTFLLELKQSELDRHTFYAVTLVELLSANNSIGGHQTPSATSSSSSTSEPAAPALLANGQQQQRAIW